MVWLVSRSTEDLLDAVLALAGLTAAEFAIYSVLSAAPIMTPTEQAWRMVVTATPVSRFVMRFESRGHVAREPNPDDRRSFRIRLTPSARRVPARQQPPVSCRCAPGSRRAGRAGRSRVVAGLGLLSHQARHTGLYELDGRRRQIVSSRATATGPLPESRGVPDRTQT
jgi:DNA-binding MarR family transcriptional regulator